MKQTCNLQLASNFMEPRYTQRRIERENKMHCKVEGFEEKKIILFLSDQELCYSFGSQFHNLLMCLACCQAAVRTQ